MPAKAIHVPTIVPNYRHLPVCIKAIVLHNNNCRLQAAIVVYSKKKAPPRESGEGLAWGANLPRHLGAWVVPMHRALALVPRHRAVNVLRPPYDTALQVQQLAEPKLPQRVQRP